MKPERLACLIASRNLGDIVIGSDVLGKLIAARYAERFIVWTRPQMAWLFEGFPNCEVICSSFPVGTRKEFGALQPLRFLAAAAQIRSLNPSVSLDLVGDFRERLFARLIGSQRHLHIGWDPTHPYTKLIRNHFGRGHPVVTVPARVSNVYAAYGLMVQALTQQEPDAADYVKGRREMGSLPRGAYKVGLHPFASQACKLWPQQNWARLARDLLERGCEVIAFSAPGEQEALRGIFAELDGRVRLSTGNLAEFASRISGLDVLIGLDSFSVHMSHRQGIPSIMINAGTPPELWAVPSGQTLAASGGCPHYPCYNLAPCRGSLNENACVEAVSPAQVLAVVESLRLAPAQSGAAG